MRILSCIAPMLLFPCCVATIAFADDVVTKKAAELKWAKGVAEDFLNANLINEPELAEALLGSDLKKIISPEQKSNEIRNWLVDEIKNKGYRSKSIDAEEIAPDSDEAQFKGILKGEKIRADFALRLVKERESGKWRVSYLLIVKHENEPAPKP